MVSKAEQIGKRKTQAQRHAAKRRKFKRLKSVMLPAPCVVCGGIVTQETGTLHHRDPRGMGGSSVDVHNPDDLLPVHCWSIHKSTFLPDCHGKIEREREWAKSRGYLV